MFGAALAIIIFGTVKAFANKSILAEDKIAICTLALLLNLIAIVALFTASLAGTNVVETAFRLHMRYYDFMLPLLFIAAGAQLDRVHGTQLKYWRLGTALVVLAIVAYAGLTQMQPFMPSHIDSPELRGYVLNEKWFMVLAALSAFAVFLWYKSANSGAIFFMFVYLPLSIAVSTAFNNAEVRQRMVIDAYDKAGLFAKSYLPPSELSKLVVIGENIASTLRALVYVDNITATRDISYVVGVPYTAAQSPADKKWVLAVGEVEFATGEFEVMRFNGYSLAKKVSSLYPVLIDFSSDLWPDSVARVTGISHAESWGAWSDGAAVAVKFSKPLPATFDLILTAKAFGPNENKVFNIEVDGHRYPVTLTADNASYTLNVSNVGNDDALIIKVPSPTSPKQLGINQDDRMLGLGLDKLEIQPVK